MDNGCKKIGPGPGAQVRKPALGCLSPTRRVALGVPFLCLLLIASGGWIGLGAKDRICGIVAPASPQGEGNGVTPATSDASAPPSSASDLAWNNPHPPAGPALDLGKGQLFFRLMLSVGLILGLGGVALYLSKRALPRGIRAGGKEIHIRETAYLGPRKALHLVEVGSERLLIASTHDRITMLATLNETWPGAPDAHERVGGPFEMPKPDLEEAAKT